jgi:hypothetical protein
MGVKKKPHHKPQMLNHLQENAIPSNQKNLNRKQTTTRSTKMMILERGLSLINGVLKLLFYLPKSDLPTSTVNLHIPPYLRKLPKTAIHPTPQTVPSKPKGSI